MIFEGDIRKKAILEVAEKMCIAARTAPKARGKDYMVISIAGEDEIKKISDYMLKMKGEMNLPHFFERDAINILSAQYMVIIGTKIQSLGLPLCGMCGYKNCEEKDRYPNHPCSFNTGDLGIAIGSAVSIAMDSRIDNRIMYTVGQAVKKMQLFEKDVKIIYGIPLNVGPKNPFFDRKL